MPDNFHPILVIGFIVLAIAHLVWWAKRSDEMVHKWARENGYHLLRADYCWFWRGPFFLTTTNSQAVFQIVVEDTYGMRRSGWVRCGSWLGGMWSDKTEVRWDSGGGPRRGGVR